jgi:serine/threonine protein kinase
MWFPFHNTSLPETLGPSERATFLEIQSAVLTKALDLEKGEQKKHVYFGKEEMLPYEVKARLGSGGFAEVDKVVSLISHKEYARKRFKRRANVRGARKEIKTFLTELQVLKKISHFHCVEIVSTSTRAHLYTRSGTLYLR